MAVVGQVAPKHVGTKYELMVDELEAVLSYRKAIRAYDAACAEMREVVRGASARITMGMAVRVKTKAHFEVERTARVLREVLRGGA